MKLLFEPRMRRIILGLFLLSAITGIIVTMLHPEYQSAMMWTVVVVGTVMCIHAIVDVGRDICMKMTRVRRLRELRRRVGGQG